MRTIYSKYHEKMQRMIVGNNFVGDKEFDEYTKYLKSRFVKEDDFLLYQYTRFYKDGDTFKSVDLNNLYLSTNGSQNDIFEGIGDWSLINKLDYNEKNEAVTDISKLYYMKCFSENKNNNLMWGHYADGHRGYCIEFDIKHKENPSWIWDVFPVEYVSKRIQVCDFQSTADEVVGKIKEGYLDETKGLFLYKDSCWKYEKEWRYIKRKDLVDSQDITDKLYVLKAPRIRSIYLGAKIEKECKEKMKEAIKEYNNENMTDIAIYGMSYDENTYILNENSISVEEL